MQADQRRREFLATLSWTAAIGLSAFHGRTLRGDSASATGYGPLSAVADETTGWELLRLPEGFRYRTYGWTGEPLECGTSTPPMHDGMAVIAGNDQRLVLARNHEVNGDGGSFGKPHLTYDERGPGGCTNLEFDLRQEKFVCGWCSLAGTARNCAGGATPWGTWLSCEETTLGPGGVYNDKIHEFTKTHGWIFEVPAGEAKNPRPLTDMGRFWHEAIAVDPATSIVYETEDRTQSGFYRFIPNTPRKLADGGRLQMMAVSGAPDLRQGVDPQKSYEVRWVDIDDPTRSKTPETEDQGVYLQGKAQGGTTFARLEGCWHNPTDNLVYFDATSGGNKKAGQIWAYDPKQELLRLVYESPGKEVLDMPDNICVSPQGNILLCEDGNTPNQAMHGLTLDGRLFLLAENNIDFRTGPRPQHFAPKDYRGEEWAGAVFSPDGRWLFVNIQSPGLTIAITGPWHEGPL